jgi:hypothetical protein
MLEQRKTFMALAHVPGRLTAVEVAWALGLTPEQVRIVSSGEVIARLRGLASQSERKLLLTESLRLKPLGSPAPRAVKFYAAVDVHRLSRDEQWLDRAIYTIRLYWIFKKRHKGQGDEND